MPNIKNTLIHGDALIELPKLEDGSIELIIVDPPYLKAYSTGHRKNVKRSTTEIPNDRILDYDFLFCQFKRILKPDGHLYFFGCWQTSDYTKQTLEKYFKIKNKLIWVKNNWTAGDLFWSYGQSYEEIWFATNGRKKLNGRRDRDVLLYDRVAGKQQLHLNQKPLDLIKFLIEKSSVPGDSILDGFAGSGTTLVAAKELGRNYIGIELEENNIKIIEERLKNV